MTCMNLQLIQLLSSLSDQEFPDLEHSNPKHPNLEYPDLQFPNLVYPDFESGGPFGCYDSGRVEYASHCGVEDHEYSRLDSGDGRFG